MGKITHQKTLIQNDISAHGTIKEDNNQFYGTWTCKECGEQSGPLSLVDSFEVALDNLNRSFGMHTKKKHI